MSQSQKTAGVLHDGLFPCATCGVMCFERELHEIEHKHFFIGLGLVNIDLCDACVQKYSDPKLLHPLGRKASKGFPLSMREKLILGKFAFSFLLSEKDTIKNLHSWAGWWRDHKYLRVK